MWIELSMQDKNKRKEKLTFTLGKCCHQVWNVPRIPLRSSVGFELRFRGIDSCSYTQWYFCIFSNTEDQLSTLNFPRTRETPPAPTWVEIEKQWHRVLTFKDTFSDVQCISAEYVFPTILFHAFQIAESFHTMRCIGFSHDNLYINASTLLTEWHWLCRWIQVNSGTFADSMVKPPQNTFSLAAFSDGLNCTPNPQWVFNVPSSGVKILSVATINPAIDLHSTLLFHHQASLSTRTPVQNWKHKFPKQSGFQKIFHARDHVYFLHPSTNICVDVLTNDVPISTKVSG